MLDLQWILLIIQIIIFASPGFKGNEWTATNLQKKGYIFDCSIEANNKKEALTLTSLKPRKRLNEINLED